MQKIIHIVTCVPDEKTAQDIVHHLLSEKLIACAHIHAAHRAHYIWEGVQEAAPEVSITLKTLPHLFEKIEKAVRNLHPYKVPYIAKTEWNVGDDYYRWMKENITLT